MEDELYIDDDCIIQSEIFIAFKDKLTCNICNKIIKDPFICKNCSRLYCNSCIENKRNCTNVECIGSELEKNTDKNIDYLLSLLKYRCKNCKEEVGYNDVEKHLKAGCKKNKEISLADFIYKKRQLKKLTPNEVETARNNNQEIYHLTGK